MTPLELYSLDTINFGQILDSQSANDTQLMNYFWAPNPKLVDRLVTELKQDGICDRIIDVGCGIGSNIFPLATHILGKSLEINPSNLEFIDMDLDFDKFLERDKSFNFVYCRHTLEDIQNPQNAFAEIVRIGKRGYIETPSPLIEITKGANKNGMRGYFHHRYIVWSDLATNTLYFLPKYPLVETIDIDEVTLKKCNHLLNNYSVYWNNYYVWDNDTNEGSQPKIIVYRNEINFDIIEDYMRLINEAVNKSVEYTNHYIRGI
jgi:hypothetical protein